MTSTHSNPGNVERRPAGAPALWASAFVIAAMVVVQAGRLGIEPRAYGDVSEVGDLTVLSTSAGAAEDVVAVLDRRGEVIYIYGIENTRDLQLYQTQNLKDLFLQARGSTRAP